MSWRLQSRDQLSRGSALLPRHSSALHRTAARGLLASGALVLSLLAAAPPIATAADLSGSSDYGSPYDDPRYADIYRHPAPRAEIYRDHDDRDDDGPRHRADDDEFDDDDVPPRRLAERERDYLPPMRSERRYSERRNNDCVPRYVIRDRLHADGWRDFQDLTIDGEVAIVSARRPSGRLFELEIHRCSGELVHARPQDSHAYGRRRFPNRS